MAVLDEISGFASEVNTGNEQGKTADNIYKAFRGTVDSRFPDLGKVVLLSFPRYQGDFISQRYDRNWTRTAKWRRAQSNGVAPF